MTKKPRKTKPGPEPERLVIEGDPEEALGRLLRTRKGGEEEMPEEKTFVCLTCGRRTPMEEAVEHHDRTLFYRCGHCGDRISDHEHGHRLLSEEPPEPAD